MSRLIPFVTLLSLPLMLHAQDAAVDIPVTRAVLFSSGVGYFEHAGQIDGQAVMTLRFKTEQINDVLKSMVFMDEGGGTVTSIHYASNDPIERALRSFGIDLSGNPTLPEILNQLRGARVTVRAPEPVAGSILSVQEKVSVVGNPPVTTTEHLLVLVTDTGIRTLPLSSIESLALAENLREELNKALALLVESRDTEAKQVRINFHGQGKRKVRVGYLVETPVWKTSYRLDLTPLADKKKPLLQGWAIVENTSDNDWNAVTLSLVSGRPISFVMDLYTPLYLQRPEVKPKLMASLTPRMYEEGIDRARRDVGPLQALRKEATTRAAAAPAAPPAVARGLELAEQHADMADGIALGASVQAAAAAGSVGELFQFTLHHPVEMPRRRSAMIPIINQDVDAEKVSIYNQSVHATHPLNGVMLRNDTGLKMLAGPVTVFDSGAYAGDAQIDHLAPGDKRLLSYAVDLAVTVDPSVKQSSSITAARIVRGVLEVTRKNVFEQTYTIRNKAHAKRTMIVEHPFVADRKLIAPETVEEKTPSLYRFRVPIDADKTGDFLVKEEHVSSQTIAILPVDPGNLVWYQRSGEISQAVRDALGRIIAQKQELVALEQQLAQKQQELAGIKQGQERLRENIKTVGADSQMGKRYLAKLSAEEDQIEALDKQIADLQRQIDAKRNALAESLKNLNVQ